MLAGLGERRFAGKRRELDDDAVLGEHIGADAAGRIDVDMGDAAAVELVEILVHIPGRARIAPMRMAGPEADAQAAPPSRAPLGEKPRRLEHGGVGAAIVHHAEIPGVVMAGEKHEGRVRPRRPVELGDEKRRLAPARVDLRVQHRLELAVGGELGAQGLAIELRDGAGDRRGEQRERLFRGASPDRRDAHLVQMLMRRDMKLAHGAGAPRAMPRRRGSRCRRRARSCRGNRRGRNPPRSPSPRSITCALRPPRGDGREKEWVMLLSSRPSASTREAPGRLI